MIIGLTGGIASGKSTAAQLLGSWGAHVIDADKLGHRAYLAGTDAFAQVVATFGEDVVGEDGEIDRAALGAKVFGGESRLDELTAIVWPAIRNMAETEIGQVQNDAGHPTVVLEAAVLIEAGWQDMVDEVWLISVEREVAIARASARDGSSVDAVQARIDAQLSNDERRPFAQREFDNSGDADALENALRAAWNEIG